MKLIKRNKPDAKIEDWRFRTISINSNHKMFLVFEDEFEEKELIISLHKSDGKQIMKFIREVLQ